MLNVSKIKTDFPIFTKYPDLVYLDSAATSQTPERVIAAMDSYYRESRGNVHRGGYALSVRASELYEASRAEAARFIGAEADEIIFTAGATHAMNMLARSLEDTLLLTKNDAIVISVMEHHSVFVTLQELAKRVGCGFRVIPLTVKGELDKEEAARMIDGRAKIVAVTSVSNVTGMKNDTRFFADRANKAGAIFIVDAAQHAGHMPISVRETGADFLFFSGHKMCGPTGTGVLWGKKERLETLKPGYFGGGAVAEVTEKDAEFLASPAKFEPGTQNIAGAIGLAEACRHLGEVGMDNIAEHSRGLARKTISALKEIQGVTVYGNEGIVSFSVAGVHAHDVAEILARENIAVRAGHHCAEPYVHVLSVPAVVRASFYFYNDEADVEKLVAGVRTAVSLFVNGE